MTDEEYGKMMKRLDEINEAVDLCDPDHDMGVLMNLLEELDEMKEILDAQGKIRLV